MSAAAPRPARCWRVIGVSGDKSCPELVEHVHCRNCPVLAEAGRALFERPTPEAYVDEWTAVLAQGKRQKPRERSLVIFRVAGEWLAVDTSLCAEIADDRPVHAVAHRSRDLLAGIANVRGQLLLCISLRGLLALSAAEQRDRAARRLLVVKRDSVVWALCTDEVHGVYRCATDDVREVPSTVSLGLAPFTVGVLAWKGHTVGILGADAIFDTLRKKIG